jgi:4-hydroxysphinganine ceramide fatty acyl 2-hydroxylase
MESTIDKIPEHLRPHNTGTDKLFNNWFMESITRTHISIPVTLHLLIVVAVSYYALQQHSWLNFGLLFMAGTFAWTFAEYCVHRFVYHTKTTNKAWLKIQHMGHGIHHQFPKDPTRLAMPPLPAVLLGSLFFGLFWLLMRSYALAFFPGFFFGYVLYISLHYAEHRVKSPIYGPYKRLWKYHALHHYKYPETKAFGVSTILWDWVFGTLPSKNEKVS